jgi:hypothetical protein
MGRLWIGLAAGALLAATSASALAQGASKSAQLQLAKQAERLKPGQWVWAPKIAPKGPILVYVDLDRQVATVYRNGIRIGVSTISSGKPGYDTPTGVFTILEKNVVHHSSKYNNASMPYQQRLTSYGVALHAGGLPGYPESHGCVHLPIAFSRLLFAAMPMGGTVIIAGRHGDPYKVPAAGVLAPALTGGIPAAAVPIAPNQDYSWNPARAASGPVSIIVSTGDQQVVVLRNGVEIGRAKAEVQQQMTSAQVMTLTGGARPEWIQVGVTDLANQPGEIISTEGVERMHLPAGFVTAMRSVMGPGTTVLVTQASVNGATTGRQTAVMDAEKPGKK